MQRPRVCAIVLGKSHLSITMAMQVLPFACLPPTIAMQHAPRNGERALYTVGAHSLQHKKLLWGRSARHEEYRRCSCMLSKIYIHRYDSAAHKAFTEVPKGAKSPSALSCRRFALHSVNRTYQARVQSKATRFRQNVTRRHRGGTKACIQHAIKDICIPV